ncbi:MAG: hypothetical protein KC493_01730 [Bacteriovoracaceae bacterium]|nr:hypothetical protein [Bacteriovoracaceae bacterium]
MNIISKTVLILLFLPSLVFSGISSKQLNQLSRLKGSYKVTKGSHKNCSDGYLNIVGKEDDKGIRIGHSIFLGPFKDSLEKPTNKNCRVSTKFKMSEKSITVKTVVDKCAIKRNLEEGKTTQHLIIKNNKLEYKVDETGYSCFYSKVEKVKE